MENCNPAGNIGGSGRAAQVLSVIASDQNRPVFVTSKDLNRDRLSNLHRALHHTLQDLCERLVVRVSPQKLGIETIQPALLRVPAKLEALFGSEHCRDKAIARTSRS